MKPPKPEPWQDFSPRKRRIVEGLMRTVSRGHTWLYKTSGGRFGRNFFQGAQVCLLTTTGRKSGKARTVPLLFLREGERFIVVASKGGDTKHPLWYLNLCADPDVSVQLDDRVFELRARTASPEEKAELWPRLVASYSDYQDYQNISDREIPVVVLDPR